MLGGSGSYVSYAYDGLNRLTSVTDAAGDKTQYSYDAASNRTGLTDPDNHVTTMTFDAQHRVLTVTDPRSGVTHYAYDLVGNETSLTDSVGNTTSFAFDKDHRITTTTNAMGYPATSSYDADSRATSATDADGRQINYSYDNAGELTGETWLSAGQAIYTATYSYDAAGQLLSESDPSSSYSDSYDAAGRLTQQVVTYPGLSGSPLVTLTYAYDDLSNRTSLTDSLGGTATYTYDGDHHLTGAQLTVGGSGANVTLSYDSLGRLSGTTATPVGGLVTAIITGTENYDAAGRLTQLTYTNSLSHTTLAQFSYGYDASSEVTSYTGPEGSLTYGYDADGQLTSVSGTVNGQAYQAGYSYDVNGNRTMTGYQTGSGNELLNDGTYTYTYDHDGNMLTRTASSGNVWSYSWDYRNRLTEVVEKNTSNQVLQDEKFTYDVENRLIQVTSLGVTQRWTVYDGANPYLDLSASGQATMWYLTNPKGRDQFLARVDPSGNVAWYLTDRLASIREIVSGAGSVLDKITYDAFGNILSETSPSNGDRFKFAGGEYDSIHLTYHVGARWYNAGTGRFDTQDPIAFGGGDRDLYRYAGNGPTARTDPSGLDPSFGGTSMEDCEQQLIDDEQACKDNYEADLHAGMDPWWALWRYAECELGAFIDFKICVGNAWDRPPDYRPWPLDHPEMGHFYNLLVTITGLIVGLLGPLGTPLPPEPPSAPVPQPPVPEPPLPPPIPPIVPIPPPVLVRPPVRPPWYIRLKPLIGFPLFPIVVGDPDTWGIPSHDPTRRQIS